MCSASEVTVGAVAIVKIGRNEITVTVTEVTANGWKVRNESNGHEFNVTRIERILSTPADDPTTETDAEVAEINNAEVAAETGIGDESEPETEAETESDEDDGTPATNPAPESGDGPRPEKKLSLLNAAAKVLETLRVPLNTKEMVAKAAEMGLWTPTDAKTPEQTLYSGIFREITGKENPRFKKSASRKGAFEFVG